MKPRADCPRCLGRGVVLDADPLKPARICDCGGTGPDADTFMLPGRYREASFPTFWKWWRDWEGNHKRQRLVMERLPELEVLLGEDPAKVGEVPQRDRLERLVHQAKTNLQHGLKPLGGEDLQTWATKGRFRFKGGWEVWWIQGPPQSGKTTFACAALKALADREGRSGRFVSVRTLSQQIKNTYYDQRGWQNADFVSVRDLIEPLKDQPALLLDEMDCLDGDGRVGAAMAELLTHRYHENLPTLITANLGPQALEQREGSSFARLNDDSLLRRLAGAERVEMIPALAWWLERL